MASQGHSVEQLFVAALGRKPEDRRAFLDRVCVDAPELRERVEELLLADEQAGSFLEKKLLTFAADQPDATRPPQGTNDRRANLSTLCPPRAGRFEPGQIIAGRFAVIRYIARGGMGEVYEVEDRFLQGVHVALKMILPHIAEDAGSAHRFEQEVLLARRITHPNLCPIYDISHCQEPSPPFLFLTMKLLSGETLASRLARTPPIPRDETLSIFRQMISGVAAIHDAGVIHRDIKPNNVMLDHSGSELCVSIMDFGLARLYESQTTVLTRGFVAGTPGYIAPELLRGDPPSQATDIFALGVLFQQMMIDHSDGELRGVSSKPSPALDTADVPPVVIHSVKGFLCEDPARRYFAFKQIQSTFRSGSSIAARNLDELPNASSGHILTRRNFVIGSALTACAATGGVVWKWDSINNHVADLLHPLPLKRFVALFNWPASDVRVRPMLEGVIDAIGGELARAEAYDRNLLVISAPASTKLTTTKQLDDIRETLGANLVLAASGVAREKDLHLTLSVLDPSSGRAIREKNIRWPLSEPITLPEKAVRAAAQLLDLSQYERNKNTATPVTQSSQAYAAFQAAEADMKQENDTGLSDAIDKYKEAIELDPRYATAYAQLAWAYLHLYTLRGDPAALSLGRSNCETALSLNPNLIVGRLGMSFVLQQIGDYDGSTRELAHALSIDPDDPRTLVLQGQLFARLNRWLDAEDSFKRAIKRRPNLWLPHDELGVVYNSEGKYTEAVAEFRTATLLVPRRAWPLNNLASVRLQQGNIVDAKAAAQRSLDLNFNDSAATTMAAALRCEGKSEDAIPFSLKAVELNPAEAGNWLELGDCYSLVRGRHGDALKAYSRAAGTQQDELKDDPKNGPGWMVLALCRVKAGSPQTARDLIAKAERALAGDLDSQLRKARTLELLGERDEALATVEECLTRGATEFQIQTMPDMESLRDDPRYTAFIKSMPSTSAADI